MFSFADKPQELRILFSHSFQLYRQTFAKVWYLATIVMVIASMQRYVPAFVNQPNLDEQGQQAVDAGANLHFVFFNTVILVLLMLVSAFFVTAIIHRLYNLARNPQANLQESFTVAKAKMVTVFAAMFIVAAIIFAGIMLFVIPGIIAAILVVFYLPNIIFSNDKVFDAITNSFKLVWGFNEFGRTVAILFPAVIIVMVTSILLMLIMGKTNILSQTLGEIIIATFIVPYFNSAILVQYNDLRLRRRLPGLDSLAPRKADQFSPPQ